MLSSYIIAVDSPAIILNTNNIYLLKENIVHIIWHTKHKCVFFSFSQTSDRIIFCETKHQITQNNYFIKKLQVKKMQMTVFINMHRYISV